MMMMICRRKAGVFSFFSSFLLFLLIINVLFVNSADFSALNGVQQGHLGGEFVYTSPPVVHHEYNEYNQELNAIFPDLFVLNEGKREEIIKNKKKIQLNSSQLALIVTLFISLSLLSVIKAKKKKQEKEYYADYDAQEDEEEEQKREEERKGEEEQIKEENKENEEKEQKREKQEKGEKATKGGDRLIRCDGDVCYVIEV